MTATPFVPAPSQPVSLEGHTIPEERLSLIAPHMRALSQTAQTVSDLLPLQADAADFVAALEAEEV
jgi:hypothetical protein